MSREGVGKMCGYNQGKGDGGLYRHSGGEIKSGYEKKASRAPLDNVIDNGSLPEEKATIPVWVEHCPFIIRSMRLYDVSGCIFHKMYLHEARIIAPLVLLLSSSDPGSVAGTATECSGGIFCQIDPTASVTPDRGRPL